MDISDNTNRNETCRLCDENAEIMFKIFDKNTEGQQIIQLIKDYLPIIIYRSDPLSKLICENCLNILTKFDKFKTHSLEKAQEYKQTLIDEQEQQQDNVDSKSIQLFLDCENESGLTGCGGVSMKSTSTDDLVILCRNCKSTINDPSLINNNEIELCAELHKAIADSLNQNKTEQEQENSNNRTSTRRRRSQAFYHELDDSLCSSSLTEFTNQTESSQCYEEYQNDSEDEDEDDMNSFNNDEDDIDDNPTPAKRPRLDNNDNKKSLNLDTIRETFENDDEICYIPLTLMQLTLNVINRMNIRNDLKLIEFDTKIIKPKCNYCNERFKNSKLLALHEINHISIELGDKVDKPILWHESRDDSIVRNKWLNNTNTTTTTSNDENNLLIQTGTSSIDNDNKYEIKLVLTKPMVNGIPLQDYTKDERKTFYKSMRIAGVNKKFCTLCRYCFKDNWAIESHYFSSACYYTCRYCGMRFNKQRHCFDLHVNEHLQNADQLSSKIYAASKLSNILPRVIQPEKVNKTPTPPTTTPNSELEQALILPTRNRNNFVQQQQQRRSLQNNTIKIESVYSNNRNEMNNQKPLMGLKSTNQAYFCRKCYKVFFKLDEFNVHSKNCDFNRTNQFPASMSGDGGGSSEGRRSGNASTSSRSANNHHNSSGNGNKNGEIFYSSTGRPMRNCVREINTYKDEDNCSNQQQQQQQSFLCSICSTPFPTIYSRNSHMRIHKGEITTPIHSQQQQHRFVNKSNLNNSYPKIQQQHNNNRYNSRRRQSVSSSSGSNFNIKQEPLEPEIQIHEELMNEDNNYNTDDNSNKTIITSLNNIGAVSITPISKNPNQRPTINPNIMKLVESNPHLTIKQQTDDYVNDDDDDDDDDDNNDEGMSSINHSYKCSNCWEMFSNKSHLYFHKKNQCQGSKYPCPFCKKRFGTESAYSSHIFYSHPE